MDSTSGSAPTVSEPPPSRTALQLQAHPQQPGQPAQPRQQTYPAQPIQPAYPLQHGQAARAAYPLRRESTVTYAPMAARAKPTAPRMAKAQAQELAARVKRWTLGLSLAGFIGLSGLVVTHNVVSATAQSSGTTSDSNSSSASTSSDDQSGSQSGSYFGQPGGSGFGSGSSSQSPVSGSSTS